MQSLNNLLIKTRSQRGKIITSLRRLTTSAIILFDQGDRLSTNHVRDVYKASSGLLDYANDLVRQIEHQLMDNTQNSLDYQQYFLDKYDNLCEMTAKLVLEAETLYSITCQMHFEYIK
jgi:hypothetical protein